LRSSQMLKVSPIADIAVTSCPVVDLPRQSCATVNTTLARVPGVYSGYNGYFSLQEDKFISFPTQSVLILIATLFYGPLLLAKWVDPYSQGNFFRPHWAATP
ncbi:hypothetical protein RRG08_020460, partial [Elysia crispata]